MSSPLQAGLRREQRTPIGTKQRVYCGYHTLPIPPQCEFREHVKALLTEMYLQGTELLASGLLTRAIIEGIQKADP
jgi:hypothetical protein